MLKRLLAMTVILAVLVWAGAVGLEAVGLLFHSGQPDSARGTDDLPPLILEEDAGEVPSEMKADLPRPGVDGESKDRDVQDGVGHDGHEAGDEDQRPEDEALAGAPEDKLGQDAGAKAVALQPEVDREPPLPVEEPKAYAAGVIGAAGARPDCTEPCIPESLTESPPKSMPKSLSSEPQQAPRRPAETERVKPVHSTASGYRSLGWPLLDWLDAALGSALAPAAGSGPPRRGAAL